MKHQLVIALALAATAALAAPPAEARADPKNANGSFTFDLNGEEVAISFNAKDNFRGKGDKGNLYWSREDGDSYTAEAECVTIDEETGEAYLALQVTESNFSAIQVGQWLLYSFFDFGEPNAEPTPDRFDGTRSGSEAEAVADCENRNGSQSFVAETGNIQVERR